MKKFTKFTTRFVNLPDNFLHNDRNGNKLSVQNYKNAKIIN